MDELHVLKRNAVLVGEAHPVAGNDAGVGVLAVDSPGTTGGKDHRPGLDQVEVAGGHLDRDDSLAATVIDHQIEGKILIETAYRSVFD